MEGGGHNLWYPGEAQHEGDLDEGGQVALGLQGYWPRERVTLARLEEAPADVSHQQDIDHDGQEQDALLVNEYWGLEVRGSRHQFVSGAQVTTVDPDLWEVGILCFRFRGGGVIDDGSENAE